MGSQGPPGSGAAVTFLPLPQPKLVLDLATSEGCKAETVTYLRNNRAVSCPGIEPATKSIKSNDLTTTPPSQSVISVDG